MRATIACLLLAGAAQERALEGARVVTPEARQNERAELALAADPAPARPFDPNAVALDATVTLPSGKSMRVPGFWFQDYKRSVKDPKAEGAARVEVLEAVGKPEWRVRFSSAEIGAHRVVLELKEGPRVRRSAPLEVKVAVDLKPYGTVSREFKAKRIRPSRRVGRGAAFPMVLTPWGKK